jgi:hypothetical protein
VARHKRGGEGVGSGREGGERTEGRGGKGVPESFTAKMVTLIVCRLTYGTRSANMLVNAMC